MTKTMAFAEPNPLEAQRSLPGSEALFGTSPAVRRVRQWIRGLAGLKVPVLLSGEHGTGRLSAARLLHDSGQNPSAPFLEVDSRNDPCPSIPLRGTVFIPDLEQQTFDDQVRWKERMAKAAEGPRFLFGAGPLLTERVRTPSFDSELAAQLMRFELRLPPLRERTEDLPAICREILVDTCQELGRPLRHLSRGGLRRLGRERWPGNVAELRRVTERLVAFSNQEEITLRDVEAVLDDVRPTVSVLRERQQASERVQLLQHLEETGGNVTATAERMNRSRAAIYRLVEKHGIRLR